MKTIITAAALILLLNFQTFPQDRNYRKVLLNELNNDPESFRDQEIHSKVVGLNGLNNKDSLLSNSQTSSWKPALKNQQGKFYESEKFNTKDSRIAINKALLSHGFLLIEEIYQTWDDTVWVNSNKHSYTYDINNNQTEQLYQTWNGAAWVNGLKYSFTYDINNNQTEELWQGWDGAAWVNFIKYSYKYDINNNMTERLYQTWGDAAWVNSGKFSFTYDLNNNQTDWLSQYWDDTAWMNVVRTSSTYGINNNLTEHLYQEWNGTGWVNNFKTSQYTYDVNNNLTGFLYQTWDGTTWINYYKDSYMHDGNNNRTEYLNQTWNDTAWVNSIKDLYLYDGNNNRTEFLNQTWNGTSWVNVSKLSYTYSQVTAINEDFDSINDYRLLNNYPNPFNPATVISWQLPVSSHVLLKVYDILGNEVATLINEEKPAGNYEVEFNAAEYKLSSGIYFYRIQTEKFVETKKLILMK